MRGSRRRRVELTLLVLCQSMQSLAFGGIGLFLPLIRKDIGLSFAQAGTLSASTLLVYALMQLPSGYLADRFGPRRLFVAGLVGTNLLTLSFASLHRYWLLVGNQAAMGFFRSLVFAPGLLLVSALFPPNRRATAMGLYVAGGFSSNVFLNLLGPVLVRPLGWRLLFELFSAGGLLVLLAYGRVAEATPRPRRHLPIREGLRLFRLRVMWMLGFIQYVRLAVASGLTFWLPTFIVADKGRSLQTAGLLVGLGAALTAPSNFLGGYVSDRLRNPLLVVGTSLAALACTTALLPHVGNIVFLVAVIAVNAIFLQLYFGPLFAVPIEMLGAEAAGRASGFSNFFANMGAFTFAYVLGAVKDATGSFTVGLYCLSGLCVLAALCTVAVARTGAEAVEPAAS